MEIFTQLNKLNESCKKCDKKYDINQKSEKKKRIK